MFTYKRPNEISSTAGESFLAEGPTNEALDVYVSTRYQLLNSTSRNYLCKRQIDDKILKSETKLESIMKKVDRCNLRPAKVGLNDGIQYTHWTV